MIKYRYLPLLTGLLTVLAAVRYLPVIQQPPPNGLAGYYTTSTNTLQRLPLYLRGKRRFIVGEKLVLRADSTYQFSTCGCQAYGRWKHIDRTVRLTSLRVDYTGTLRACRQPTAFSVYRRYLINERLTEERTELFYREE